MANVSIGPSQEYLTSGREYLHSREAGHVMKKTVILSSAATDQQSTLRKGLALGKVTASGKYSAFGVANSPAGTNVFRGFLDNEVDLRDDNGVAQDCAAQMVVFGRVKETNTVGVTAQAKTDASLGANGCFFIWD
jgi:hypothetical protein